MGSFKLSHVVGKIYDLEYMVESSCVPFLTENIKIYIVYCITLAQSVPCGRQKCFLVFFVVFTLLVESLLSSL